MEKQFFYSVEDVRKILGIGKAKSYALMKSNGFPAIKLSGTYKVSVDLFDKWVADVIANGGEFQIEPKGKK